MKTRIATCAAVVLVGGCLFSPLALAADLPMKSLPILPPPAFSWTGWYLGGSVGYGTGNSGSIAPSATPVDFGILNDVKFQLASVVPVINAPFETRPQGPLGGLQFGYNEQISRFVWGFEVDYSWADIKGSATRTESHPSFFGPPVDVNTTTVAVSNQLKSFGTIRGRIGLTPTEHSLLYATGGLAYGLASSGTAISVVQMSGLAPGAETFSPASGSVSKTLPGWTVGGGGEWAFAPHWSVKAEYLYYDLGSLSYSIPAINLVRSPVALGMISTAAISARFSGSIARVGINYHFAGP